MVYLIIFAAIVLFAAAVLYRGWRWSCSTTDLLAGLEASRVAVGPKTYDPRELDGFLTLVNMRGTRAVA